MSKINILPSEIFNRIAAGEVVDRPASIVKELVENSIDAGADKISIDIKNGGITYIKVSDNGSGIESEYVKTAFTPHATSKIGNLEDLNNISTLGFRGEALPSIASVSKVKLVTRTKSDEMATSLEIKDGEFIVSKKGAPCGTYITVEDLFYNIPARAKFLKKPSAEESEITNLIQRLILANPNISIKYTADGENLLKSDGQGVENAIYSVYGKESLEKSLQIHSIMSDIVLKGFVGKEEYSKPNRTYQTLIINGRYVVNKIVSDAVANAYSDRLMKRQFPFFVLYMTIPFDMIDVNVHPNKLDVRFFNDSTIYNFIYNAVAKLLKESYTVPAVDLTNTLDNEKTEKVTVNTKGIVSDESSVNITSRLGKALKTTNNYFLSDTSAVSSDLFKRVGKINNEQIVNKKNFEQQTEIITTKAVTKTIEDRENNAEIKKTELQRQTVIESKLLNKISVIGVVFETYILIQYDEDLYFIDQHAAHERLLYDKLSEDFSKNSVQKQALLVPYVFDVNTIENQFLNDNLDILNKNGFETEEFGRNAYKINTVPLILSDIDLKSFIYFFLKDITNQKKNNIKDYINSKLMQEACKAAIKGGDSIPKEELINLLNNIIESGCTLMCPHGRPIAVKVSKVSLEKWFKRIVN